MSLHSKEKHLAVLEAVFERGMSVRKAARAYGADKGSVTSWMTKQRSGELTINKLRAEGVVPESPQFDIEAATLTKVVPVVAMGEVAALRERSDALYKKLMTERNALNARLAEVHEALSLLPEPRKVVR